MTTKDEKETEAAAVEEESVPAKHASHLRNDFHPPVVQWGILLFLLGTFVLLVFADFGSGVTAASYMMQDNAVRERQEILNVSVVSSVGKLWEARSYPLAVFIAITSIGWPYIKLILATVSWVTPYKNPRRREFFIEVIDALGKWSFVDIMVLVEIMVAFRSSVKLGPNLSLDIVIVAQWGFYGFVIATMLSLASTHIILHYHRKVHYHGSLTEDGCDEENVDSVDVATSMRSEEPPREELGIKAVGNFSTRFMVVAVGALVLSMVLFVAGVTVETFTVTSTRGEISETIAYSIASIGMDIPEAYVIANHSGTQFIQFMWFFLGIATPLLCSALFLALYTIPTLTKKRMETIFTAGEITFAWSCAEVLFLSTIFAVQQMPVFGDGLVDNNCAACFQVDTDLLPEFAVLCLGTIMNVGVNVWLYRTAHKVIFPQPQ